MWKPSATSEPSKVGPHVLHAYSHDTPPLADNQHSLLNSTGVLFTTHGALRSDDTSRWRALTGHIATLLTFHTWHTEL